MMKQEKVKYNMGFPVNMVICIMIHLAIVGLIYWKVKKDFSYLLKFDIVQKSMNEYIINICIISLIAILLSIGWWSMAYMKNEIGKWYEENATACVILLSMILLAVVIFGGYINKGIKDDLGTEHVLHYSYYVWLGFLINLFGFPPQTVKDVILPGGTGMRIAVAVIAACVVLWGLT